MKSTLHCLSGGRRFPKFTSSFWILSLLAVSVIYPRLILLGSFPEMDEGLFVWLTQRCHEALAEHAPLPMAHGLPLQSLLLSWVYFLPGFPVIWLRLFDMLFACMAAWLLCRIYQHECGSYGWGLIFGLIFICPMNYEDVIDHGCKNSIPLGLFFLFTAIRLLQKKPDATSARWFWAGVCTGLAVFFREPFFVFAILGFFTVWIYGGFTAALRYGAGGLATIPGILALLALAQGGHTGLEEMIQSYGGRGLLYAQEAYRIKSNLIFALQKSRLYFEGPVCVTILAALAFIFFCLTRRGPKKNIKMRGAFWLCAMLFPLLEPLTKIGFVYHLAVCLPGLGGLCSFFFAESWGTIQKAQGLVPAIWRTGAKILALACAVCAISGLPPPAQGKMTIAMLRNFPEYGWPGEYVDKSNVLMAARIIRENLPPHGTLASSAFSFNLFEASGAKGLKKGYFDPADQYTLNDLSRAWFLLGKDRKRFLEALEKNLPDALVIGKARQIHEKDYADELVREIVKSGKYRLCGIVPWNGKRHQGWMKYLIFVRK